jgi:membrane protein
MPIQPQRYAALLLLVLRRAAVATYQTGLMEIAKGVAFSALLCFLPVLTTLATLLVQANAEHVSQAIVTFLFDVVPPGTGDLVQYAFTMRGARPNWLFAGAAALSIWAASDVIVGLMSGFQAAYRTPNRRSFWRQRLVAISLVFSVLLPLVAASALLVFASNVEYSLLFWAGLLPDLPILANIAVFAARLLSSSVAITLAVLVTNGLYSYAPSLPKRWDRVWLGTLVATFLWTPATLGFGWYARNIASYNIMYGSIGAAIALLVWLYLLSLIALFGCACNAELEKLRKEGTLP